MATTPTNPSITLGGSNTDGVTVTGVGGVTPTGTVTFYVCGPFTSATACTAAGTKLGTVDPDRHGEHGQRHQPVLHAHGHRHLLLLRRLRR